MARQFSFSCSNSDEELDESDKITVRYEQITAGGSC